MGKINLKTTVDGLGASLKERTGVLGGFNLPRQPNPKADEALGYYASKGKWPRFKSQVSSPKMS